jgi:hypothetical protein
MPRDFITSGLTDAILTLSFSGVSAKSPDGLRERKREAMANAEVEEIFIEADKRRLVKSAHLIPLTMALNRITRFRPA